MTIRVRRKWVVASQSVGFESKLDEGDKAIGVVVRMHLYIKERRESGQIVIANDITATRGVSQLTSSITLFINNYKKDDCVELNALTGLK